MIIKAVCEQLMFTEMGVSLVEVNIKEPPFHRQYSAWVAPRSGGIKLLIFFQSTDEYLTLTIKVYYTLYYFSI